MVTTYHREHFIRYIKVESLCCNLKLIEYCISIVLLLKKTPLLKNKNKNKKQQQQQQKSHASSEQSFVLSNERGWKGSSPLLEEASPTGGERKSFREVNEEVSR